MSDFRCEHDGEGREPKNQKENKKENEKEKEQLLRHQSSVVIFVCTYHLPLLAFACQSAISLFHCNEKKVHNIYIHGVNN